jgi:tetratricopeptide (TPR) repeat protein
MKKIVLTICFLNAIVMGAFTQNTESADEKLKKAIELMDNGKIEESITLLKEAKKLDPKNSVYDYEMAYAYYISKDYAKAAKTLKPILNKPDAKDLYYQLYGNALDLQGKRKDALKAYADGLNKFPNSGRLFLEISVILINEKQLGDALTTLEAGVKVEPTYSSNYYWLTKIFLNTDFEVWGMLYGEIFMNIERTSKRTTEIGKMLFNTYKSEIKFDSDTSVSISFCKTEEVNVDEDDEDIRLPFGTFIYETTLLASIPIAKWKTENERKITIKSLCEIRKNFIEQYYNNFHHDEKYPVVLFDYHKRLIEKGFFEAYNYWLFLGGDYEEFILWKNANKENWEAFVQWFNDNPINLNVDNYFHRTKM